MIEISKKFLRIVAKANIKYTMFEEGDQILLALSGGKDSLALAHILKHFSSVSPIKWTFKAATVDYGINQDFSYIIKHCKINGINHEIIRTDAFSIMKENLRENSTICSFCARMRRGYLYSYALSNGFNKLAIAHHFDDAAESFFMNFTYNGTLRTLAPKYVAKNGLTIIRPLIFARERQIQDFAIKNRLQVLGDECCPAYKLENKMPKARAKTKQILKELEKSNQKLFVSMKSAFENIHTQTFF